MRNRNRSLGIGAAVLLVSLTVGYAMSQSLTRPLRQIAAAADAFGRGETDVDLPTEAGDETGVVARSLRQMMDQVQERTASLNAEIGERQRAEQDSREQSARTQAILDGATDAIITISSDGVIESFNRTAEQMFGYTANEAIGKNVKLLMPSPYRDEHDQHIRNYLATGISRIIGIRREALGLRADNTIFPIDLAVSEVTLGDQRLFTGYHSRHLGIEAHHAAVDRCE